jgi:hypothetical protein
VIDRLSEKENGEVVDEVINATKELESVLSQQYIEELQEAKSNVLDEQEMMKVRNKYYDSAYLRSIYQFHTTDSQHFVQLSLLRKIKRT